MSELKPIAIVNIKHMVDVSFFADTDFGTAIPDGTKLYSEFQVKKLQQRIKDLEQQLKTANVNAFLAGCRYADQPIRGMKSMNDLRVAAEQYASKLEQGEG